MIYETYIKESKIIDKTDEEKSLDLVKSLIKTKMDLELASKNFEFADGELVDYYAYQIKANQAKINYLLKKIKRRGLIIDNKTRSNVMYICPYDFINISRSDVYGL